MKEFLLTFIILTSIRMLSAQVIHIPADYASIQQGIDSASDGDTVLVSPGTYLENVTVDGKSITMASLFLTTQDTAYIAQTVIDGQSMGSVISFLNGADSTALLCGFTLTGGYANRGGGIFCNMSNPKLENLILAGNTAYNYSWWFFLSPAYGGGVSFFGNSHVKMKNVEIRQNTSQCYGGGISVSDHSYVTMQSVTIVENSSPEFGGGVYCDIGSFLLFDSLSLCNIYFNQSGIGHDLYSDTLLNVFLNLFTVDIPTQYHAFPITNFNFNILQGIHNLAVADVYVSPTGNNYNSGLSASDPIKTVQCAHSFVLPDSVNLPTIHLLPGLYSPSTNAESFPIVFLGNTIIAGDNDSTVILDSENSESVIIFENIHHASLSGLTIRGGSPAGILCNHSEIMIQDVRLADNSGAGIIFIDSSYAKLENVKILNNQNSGLIAYSGSVAELSNVTIAANSAFTGSGIFCDSSTIIFDSIKRSNIYLNQTDNAPELYSTSFMEVVLDTFTVMLPNSYYAEPLANFSFDIKHSKISQVCASVYVSPSGNNYNSGLSPGDPLKTIRAALSVIHGDSLNPQTIHLLNGTYSTASNEESYPIKPRSFVNLQGDIDSMVVLDAGDLSAGIVMTNVNSCKISGMTVQNSSTGISCDNSGPVIQNVIITNNWSGIELNNGSSPVIQDLRITSNDGFGVFCSNSNPVIKGASIDNNSGSGLHCQYNSNVIIENSRIEKNNSSAGGGIYCASGVSLAMKNVSICNNTAGTGGGIYAMGAIVFDSISRCNIYNNEALDANDFYSGIAQDVIVDTFSVLYPTTYHASSLPLFTFDILHGFYDQVNADLFINPLGDNNNSGLSASEPMKTMHFALSRLRADSLSPHSIHLSSGHYSPTSTGEIFPLTIPDFVSIDGSSSSAVILDAEGRPGIFRYSGSKFAHLSGLTVSHSMGDKGSIYCFNSRLFLEDVVLKNNYGYDVSGIFADSSVLQLSNVRMFANEALFGCFVSMQSHTFMRNVIVADNQCTGVFLDQKSTGILTNVLITGNTGNYGFGLRLANKSAAFLTNSIVLNTLYKGIVFDQEGDSNEITISYSNIEGGQAGINTHNNGTVNWLNGNIYSDPLYLGAGSDPYSLSAGSPCIDAGTTDTTGLGLPNMDILGHPRFMDGNSDGMDRIDMGPYEFDATAEVSDIKLVDAGLLIYPNPARNELYLKTNTPLQQATLIIHNSLGQEIKVFRGVCGNLHFIDCSGFQEGIYCIILKSTNMQFAGKFVICKFQ